MTVSSTGNSIVYHGDGSSTTFGFPFPIVEASALIVATVDSNGAVNVLTLGSQYEVLINTPISPNPTDNGGTVVLGAALPLGTDLVIERNLPLVQDTSLQNQGTLWQTVIEQALDYLTLCVQQVQLAFGRFLIGPTSDPPGINYTLPTVTQRAGKALIFDAQGNVTSGVTPATGFISGPMVPVVEASSIANARTQLGLGNVAVTNISNGLANEFGNLVPIDLPLIDNTSPIQLGIGNHAENRLAVGSVAVDYVLPAASSTWFGYWVDFIVNCPMVSIKPFTGSNDVINFGPPGQQFQFGQGTKFRVNTDGVANWYVTELSSTPASPGGYLSVVPNQNTFTANVTGAAGAPAPNASKIYYNPDVSSSCPVWVGDAAGGSGDFVNQPITNNSSLDLSFAVLGDTRDIWAWGSAGSNILEIWAGDPWTGPTTRPVGLTRVRGIWVNSAAVLVYNGGNAPIAVPALQGTYLGTFHSDQNGMCTCNNATGQGEKWGIWNFYNRRDICLHIYDPNTQWIYSSNIGPQASNGNPNNSAVVMMGLPQEERLFGSMSQTITTSLPQINITGTETTTEVLIGFGFNTQTAFQSTYASQQAANVTANGTTQLAIEFPGQLSLSQDLGSFIGPVTIYALEQVVSGSTGAEAIFWGSTRQMVTLRWKG
jgi:hypothetical protein